MISWINFIGKKFSLKYFIFKFNILNFNLYKTLITDKMGKELKKGSSGYAKKYIARSKAIRKL